MPNPSKSLLLALASNRRKWDRWHEDCRKEAEKEFLNFKDNPLFVAGVMLYWGEGDKVLKNGIVRLSNSEPTVIKIFYEFLKNFASVKEDKIFLKLILYPDLVESFQQNEWGKKVGIPLKQFKRSVVIKGKHPTKRSARGIGSMEVYSRKLKEKIIRWTELYGQDFDWNSKPMLK